MHTFAHGQGSNMTTTFDSIKPRRESKTERKHYSFRASVLEALKALSKREGISEAEAVSRAVEKESRKLPILGEIPCGPLADVPEEHVEDRWNVGDIYKVRDGDFLLRARGLSMSENGILDGDLVLIRPQDFCDSGEVAAVLIDSPFGTRATLKKVLFSSNSPIVTLMPTNPEHESIEIDTTQQALRICGVKRGVIRVQ